jgi:hypothetical protein
MVVVAAEPLPEANMPETSIDETDAE